MKNQLELFQSFGRAMQDALESQDWDAVSVLDSRCRALIGSNLEGIDPDLREQIEALSRLYIELQKAARAERERVASELTRLNQSKQVDQAYKTFG